MSEETKPTVEETKPTDFVKLKKTENQELWIAKISKKGVLVKKYSSNGKTYLGEEFLKDKTIVKSGKSFILSE